MSSSHSKRQSRGSEYPSQWSEWGRSEVYERRYRSRLRGPGDYEYEYEQQPPSTPRGPGEGLQSITDRNYPRPNTSTKPYTTTKTDVAEDITSSRSQTSLGPAPDPFSSSGSSVPPYLSTGTPYIAGIHSSAAPYVSSPEIEQSDASPSTGWQNHIRTSDPATDREEFDPHYKVHGAWQFKWGRVFKVLWAEPTGVDGMGSGLSSETSSFTGREMVAKIRRFMIIKPMEGHCICLPILTYSGQGVRKRGVHAQHHAIIYSGKKPVAFRGEKEKGLEMRSIKFSPDNPRYRLDDASRLNYAKIYTVEYNARVWFIGKIHADSEWQVRTDYNRVNPPLEIKGSRPSGTAVDDASEHQRGAEYGSASMGSGKPNRGSSTTSLSFGSRPVVQEHLVNVVRQDAELRALCDQAIHGSGWGHFEKNLRRCLVQLSKEIRNEMQSRQATQAARAIRTFARSAAQSIKGALELQKSTKETSELKAEMYDLSTQVDPNSESSHGDETDAIDELEEDHMAEFKYFEDLVVSSKSFEWFKERFHLCVNLDQARSAVFQQWPRLSPKSPRLSPKSSHLSLLSPKSSQQSLFYDIECDLEFFIDTHVKDPTQIGNLIVITGEAVHAEALSCREYLSRACPDISTLLLKSIELLSLHKSNLCIQNEEAKLEIIRTEAVAGEKPQVSLKATAVYKIHVQIATAVSWMCASFQSSPHAEIMMSSVLVNVAESTPTNGTSITIRPGALHQPSARSCWHSLFPNRVVARGFPVSSRHQGVGLEISFENMATASRCLTFVGYENGLIAHGLISVLIPMKILEKDDALQWHLEDKRNQKQYKLARISQVLSSSPAFQDRLKERQPEYLVGKRCFLGLAEHANVVIGTKSYQRSFEWSRSPFAPTKTSDTSYSITFGTSVSNNLINYNYWPVIKLN